MAQLRTRSRRATIDNGHGHELTVLPKTRKPADDFCSVHHRLTIKVNDARREVAVAGKFVVKSQSQRNIAALERCKKFLNDRREDLMTHLLTCETCTK